MGEIIFVRTRHHYVPYDDFFRLAELSGYPVIYVDEMLQHDSKDTTFIISPVNGEWNTRPRGYTQGRVILYQLEWNWDGEHNTPSCVDEVWNCDPAHAAKNGFRYVPMGSNDALNCLGTIESKLYDVALLSYQTPRRQVITNQLLHKYLTLSQIEQLWGEDRTLKLLMSRTMVHVHQREDTKGIAPLRWCLAAAHHLPIISETVPNRGIFGYTHMMQADYNFLASFTASALKDRRMLSDYAEALHGLLCRDYTFKVGVDSHV